MIRKHRTHSKMFRFSILSKKRIFLGTVKMFCKNALDWGKAKIGTSCILFNRILQDPHQRFYTTSLEEFFEPTIKTEQKWALLKHFGRQITRASLMSRNSRIGEWARSIGREWEGPDGLPAQSDEERFEYTKTPLCGRGDVLQLHHQRHRRFLQETRSNGTWILRAVSEFDTVT